MSSTSLIAHLSEELQAEYVKPRPNEIRTYELLGITRKKSNTGRTRFTIPNSRMLPDSYVVIDGDEQKTIMFTSRMLPTNDPNQVRRSVEPIEFRQENGGAIRITPDNYPRMAELDKFLFFSPWCKPNYDENGKSDRKWQSIDRLGHIFQLKDPRGEAENATKEENAIIDAKVSIRNMTEKDIDMMVVQCGLGLPSYLSLVEKSALLNKHVSTYKNAIAFNKAINEEDYNIRKIIKEAVSKKIIANNEMAWYYTDGEEVIISKMAGKSLEDSLVFYFKTKDGKTVKELINNTIEAKKESPIKKKGEKITI